MRSSRGKRNTNTASTHGGSSSFAKQHAELESVTPTERITNSLETAKNDNNANTPQHKVPSKFLLSTSNLDALEPYEMPVLNDTPTRKRPNLKEENKEQKLNTHEEIQKNPKKKVKIEPLPIETPSKKNENIDQLPPGNPQQEQYHDHLSTNDMFEHTHHQKPIKQKSQKVISPPKFQPTAESLIESKEDLDIIGDVFRDIDDKVIKDQYLSFANLDFAQWINKGVEITNKQHELIRKIVVVRARADMKFRFIFKLINDYGQSLETEDTKLVEKMKKLKKMGEEIKSFIS